MELLEKGLERARNGMLFPGLALLLLHLDVLRFLRQLVLLHLQLLLSPRLLLALLFQLPLTPEKPPNQTTQPKYHTQISIEPTIQCNM